MTCWQEDLQGGWLVLCCPEQHLVDVVSDEGGHVCLLYSQLEPVQLRGCDWRCKNVIEREGLQTDTDLVPHIQLSEITLRYIKCHQDILSIQ